MTVRSSKARVHGRLPGRFRDLVAEMPPRPIRDEIDYRNTIEMLDRLTSLATMTKGQADYLETLAVLVDAYEAEHHAIDASSITPLHVLKHLIEQQGMNGSQLGELLGGNRSLGGKILRGERQLSKAHVRVLAERFKVSPGLFL